MNPKLENTTASTNHIDYMTLPGFIKAKRHLEDSGHPSEWLTEVVDTTQKGACFLKSGRPWYRSLCPYYEGYWLHGGVGSVQCAACRNILPGLVWDTTCKEGFEKCPFYMEKGGNCIDNKE